MSRARDRRGLDGDRQAGGDRRRTQLAEPEQSGGWRPGGFLVSRGMDVRGPREPFAAGWSSRGRKLSGRHCGRGDRGKADLRRDQANERPRWSRAVEGGGLESQAAERSPSEAVASRVVLQSRPPPLEEWPKLTSTTRPSTIDERRDACPDRCRTGPCGPRLSSTPKPRQRLFAGNPRRNIEFHAAAASATSTASLPSRGDMRRSLRGGRRRSNRSVSLRQSARTVSADRGAIYGSSTRAEVFRSFHRSARESLGVVLPLLFLTKCGVGTRYRLRNRKQHLSSRCPIRNGLL